LTNSAELLSEEKVKLVVLFQRIKDIVHLTGTTDWRQQVNLISQWIYIQGVTENTLDIHGVSEKNMSVHLWWQITRTSIDRIQ